MKRLLMPLLVVCLVRQVFAQDESMRKMGRQVIGSHVFQQYLEYGRDEVVLRRHEEKQRRSHCLNEHSLLQADARKIGEGSLLVEYTMGMCLIEFMSYLVEHDGKTVSFDVRQIDWLSHEMILKLPGQSLHNVTRRGKSLNLKRGEIINRYCARLDEKYGNVGTSTLAERGLDPSSVMTWNIGEGCLEIKADSISGIVVDIAYVVGNKRGNNHVRLCLKEVDLEKDEVTIVISER